MIVRKYTMFTIGAHLSFSNGFMSIAEESDSIGANTFQFFTRNPRGSKAKPLDPMDIKLYLDFAEKEEFGTILAHAPYTLNAAAKEERILIFTKETIADDLDRMDNVPGSLYNMHPGAHVGQGVDKGIDLITELLNSVLSEDHSSVLLLETMAGKGTEIGRSFDELRRIIEGVTLKELVGVCLDTCHIYDGGYDIVNDLEGVLHNFEDEIGLHKLYAVHLNDSKNPFGSHKDRHEKIGEGSIGLETFRKIINHDKLRDLPFFLETPQETPSGYKEEILLLKRMREED
jgi:deoxyribonuclease-4